MSLYFVQSNSNFITQLKHNLATWNGNNLSLEYVFQGYNISCIYQLSFVCKQFFPTLIQFILVVIDDESIKQNDY